MRTFKGNLDRTIDGKDVNLKRDALKLVKRYMPAGNLWYSRLVLERLVFDALEEMADPKIHSKRRSQERRLKKESGQKYWWKR